MGELILVVDDDKGMASVIGYSLELEGYRVLTASDGQEALHILERVTPDLIIADIRMPRMDGYALYEAVRQDERWYAIPFIFLTGMGKPEDVRLGKRLGADDYLVKPISDVRDLTAAVSGKLKRAAELRAARAGEEGRIGVLKVGDLVIDLKQRTVTVAGQPIHLTPLEFEILVHLAGNANTVLSLQELVRKAYGYERITYEEAGTLIRSHIMNLRRKIEPGSPRIVTVHGIGYKLEETT